LIFFFLVSIIVIIVNTTNTAITGNSGTFTFFLAKTVIMSSTTPSDGESLSNVEIIYYGNELPSGELQRLLRILHADSKSRCHPFLAEFISNATLTVKEEISYLATQRRRTISPFESLSTWVESENMHDGPLGGAVDGVMLTFVQIAMFIR
jgi:monodictyphenone polyketide synthase